MDIAFPEQKGWEKFEGSYFDLLANYRELDCLDNVYVLGDSALIVDQNLNLVRSTLNEHLYWLPRTLSSWWMKDNDLKKRFLDERIAFLSYVANYHRGAVGSSVRKFEDVGLRHIYLAHAFGWYAFGHLFDSIQRLFPLRGSFKKGRDKFVVSRFNRISCFLDHLSIAVGFEVEESDIMILERGSSYFFQNLVVPYSPALITNFTRNTYSWLIPQYLDRYISASDQNSTLKLYLSRNHVSPGRRSVLNEDQLLPAMREAGFVIVTGNEHLSEIVHLFWSASVVVGPHGSLFANSIFCNPSCKIIEYCPENRIDYSFRNKYKMAQDYRHYLVPADENFNIKLSMRTILAEIEC